MMYRTGRSRWGWTIVFTTFLINILLLPFRVLAARNAKLMRRLKRSKHVTRRVAQR